MLFELLVSFLICAGIGLCFLCVAGLVLLPMGRSCDTVVKLHLYGDARGLEEELRTLHWLRRCGFLCVGVELIDCGLNEEGRLLAAKLAQIHQISLHN